MSLKTFHFFNQCISVNTNLNESEQQSTIQIQFDNLQFEIVDYSEKAIALFGDTMPIKDLLFPVEQASLKRMFEEIIAFIHINMQ